MTRRLVVWVVCLALAAIVIGLMSVNDHGGTKVLGFFAAGCLTVLTVAFIALLVVSLRSDRRGLRTDGD